MKLDIHTYADISYPMKIKKKKKCLNPSNHIYEHLVNLENFKLLLVTNIFTYVYKQISSIFPK